MATFEYDKGYVVYEMRLWTPYKQEGHDNGNIFYCDKGWVSIGRGGWAAFSRGGEKVAGGGILLKAVRSRKNSDLTADVVEGHYTSLLCHSANVAMLVGKRLEFDPRTEMFVGDGAAEANKLRTKEYRKGFELPEWS
jgi:hypothetical protein